MPVQTITIPRRSRAGSITSEQVAEVAAALDSGALADREAVVVAAGIESENTARNRARSLAVLYEQTHGAKLSAHAVPDPGQEGAWVAAVTFRPAPPTVASDKRSRTELADAAVKAGLDVQGSGQRGKGGERKVLRSDYIAALAAVE